LLHLPRAGPEAVQDLAAKEKQVVENRDDRDELVDAAERDDAPDEKRGVHPGQPLDLDGDDKPEQDLHVRKEGGHGEEHREVQVVGDKAGHTEGKSEDDVEEHARKVKETELRGAPAALQERPDKKVEVEGERGEESCEMGYRWSQETAPER
jgi:hypothetical protein